MRTFRTCLLALLVAGAALSAADGPPAPLQLDAKAFTLAKATIAPIPGSESRGILFGADDATATAALKLAPGKYQIVIHMYGADDEHDALLVAVGGEEYRVYAGEKASVVAHNRAGVEEGAPHELPLTVTSKEPVNLELKTAETGVIVERVVVSPAAPAPAPAK